MGGRAARATIAAIAFASLGPATHAQTGKPTLFLIGDSTVKVGTTGQVGWGERIADDFDPAKIAVVNAARGGRSSRTFQTEGLWDRIALRYEQMGPERVNALFPSDHTHTNQAGADINAASVIAGLKGLEHCDLCAYFSPQAAEVPAWRQRDR